MIEALLDGIMAIDWQRPFWLLLVLQPLFLWLAIQWQKSNHQQRFADKHLLPWIKVENSKTIWQKIFSRDVAYSLAWIGFALALAGPRIPDQSHSDPSQTKYDVMLVMDLSRSMYATDIKPSRLRRAVLEAYEFLSIAKSMRVSVIVYAARPHLYVPFTHDFNALKFYLKDTDTLELPTQGSDPAAAIRFAQKKLEELGGSQKSIVWITDGDLTAQQFEKLGQALKLSEISVHALGIATDENVAIPLADGSWLTNKGQGVITSANLDQLEKTIKKWGGVFSIVSDDESDWQRLYQQGILKDRAASQVKSSEQWKQLYPWFLLPAFLLLFSAYFPSLKTVLIILILSSFLAFTTAKAEEAYLDRILEGESGYLNEDFDHAKRAFIQAVLEANSSDDRAVALHNLGNSLFQMGDYATATRLYSDALRQNPKQEQSMHNQKLSYELYKALERRQRNQQMQGNLGTPSRNSLLQELPDRLPQSANTQAVIVSEFTLPKLPKEAQDKLLKKGLAHIKLLQANGEKNKQEAKEEHNLDEARLYLLGLGEQLKPSSNPLWKRLFEIEEGFPGDLDKPEEIPGVQPW